MPMSAFRIVATIATRIDRPRALTASTLIAAYYAIGVVDFAHAHAGR
jgi:hypothetical protein